MAWYFIVLDIAVLATTVIFSLVSASHIVLTWCMRKDFHVAVRSPGLATLLGCAGTIMSCVAVFRDLLGFWPNTGAWDLLGTLMLLTLYTGAYVCRGVRLLVMYNPRTRKRWGRFIREPFMMMVLLGSFAVLSIVVISACFKFGVKRVAGIVLLIYVSDNVVTLGACLVLFGKLRRTDDMFNLSLEIRRVGAFALLALVMTPVYVAFHWRYMMFIWMMARFQFALWFTNIQPARAALRLRAGLAEGEGSLFTSLFPWVPWRRHPTAKVAVDRQTLTPIHSPRDSITRADGVLDSIMRSPPLLEAFGEYCRKALCSEMLMFLRDVEEFSTSLYTASTSRAASRAKKGRNFAEFVVILNTYIKDGSPFEIEIETETKNDILKMADREAFDKLTRGGRDRILRRAAKEVANVLSDNLCSKFAATEQYKLIQDQRSAVEQQVEGGQVCKIPNNIGRAGVLATISEGSWFTLSRKLQEIEVEDPVLRVKSATTAMEI